MHLGTLFRTHDLANGYGVTAATTTFYTDLDTGKLLTTIKHPITGKAIDVRYFPPQRLGPRRDLARPYLVRTRAR